MFDLKHERFKNLETGNAPTRNFSTNNRFATMPRAMDARANCRPLRASFV